MGFFDPVNAMSEQRMKQCRACEFRREYGQNLLQCGKCKCIMNIKTRIPGFKCPIGKYPALTIAQMNALR
jgi:hypothetical protein